MAAPSSLARSIIAGGASRSWSATITASAGCRPMSRPTAPEAQLLADLPADQPPAAAPTSIRSRGASVLRYDTMYVETGRYLRQLIRDVQLAGGRIAGPRVRDAGRHRRLARAGWSSTAPASAAAPCSTTRTCVRPAASSPSSCRSPRSATPSPAAPATCSRAPTASSSAARSSSTSGTRRPSRTTIARILAVAPALLRQPALHRLKCLVAASDIVQLR